MKKNLCYALISIALLAQSNMSLSRQIALTIDDLPFVGSNDHDQGNMRRSKERFISILNSVNENHIPATGFIIAGAIGKGQWELLENFRNSGLELGNHTYSHANLNKMTPTQYISEIEHADQVLAPIMTTPKYFRYPYLAEGKGSTKQEVQDYLIKQQYTVAPVTIDSKDYMFNAKLLHIPWRVRANSLKSIKQQYLSFIWKQTLKAEKHSPDKAQILLIHANLLNSLFLNDVIQMYKKNGYEFVTLDKALKTSPVSDSLSTDNENNNFNSENDLLMQLIET